MICGYAKREIGGEDPGLEAFHDFRLKLIWREARSLGFAVRRVTDAGGEYLEVYPAGGSTPAVAAAFAVLARRLRACDLGTLSFEVDSSEETEALEVAHVYSPLTNGLLPLAVGVEVRGEGFARELSREERREIDTLQTRAAEGADKGVYTP